MPPIIENQIYEDKNDQLWGQTANVYSEKNQFFGESMPKKSEGNFEVLLNSNKKLSEDLCRSKIQKEELSAIADELLRENDGLKFAATELEQNLTKSESKNKYLESKFVQIYNTQVQSAISNYESIGTENKRLTSKACDKIAQLNEEVFLLSKERHSTLKKLELEELDELDKDVRQDTINIIDMSPRPSPEKLENLSRIEARLDSKQQEKTSLINLLKNIKTDSDSTSNQNFDSRNFESKNYDSCNADDMKNLREQLNLINSMGADLRTKNNALATRIDKLDDFTRDEKYLQLSIRKDATDTVRRREEKYKCLDVLYEVKREYEGTLDL